MKHVYKTLIAALLFFAVVSTFFYLLIEGIQSDYTPAMSMEEIEQTDLSTKLVPLTTKIAQWYPNALYAPGEFENALAASQSEKAMYGTYRICLKLPAGQTYGITGLTCSYAQRVYVNGVLLSEVGKVTDSPEGFVPRTDSYSIFFAPDSDETEIVVQLAHWNNKNGYFNTVYLGHQVLVERTARANALAGGLIVGTLFAFAVFFFGMFLFYLNKRYLLWFALTCFCSGLYFFIFQNKDIMALIPHLPWALSHKLEYLSQLGCYVLLLAYAASMTKVRLNKWLRLTFFILVGSVMLYYIIAPSTFYSYYKKLPMGVYAHSVAFGTCYVLFCAIRQRLYRRKEALIVLLCLLVGTGVYIFDFITDRNYNVMPFGTMLMVFFSAIAITMQFSRIERELGMAQLREKQISQTNMMLAHMSELKDSFLHTIAHEMKTPLTVMSGFAQITEWQLQEGSIDEGTRLNLKNIYEEALRLSAMVEQLSEYAFGNELKAMNEKVSVKALLQQCAELCALVVKKRNNRLTVACEEDIAVRANRDAIMQVLFNLIVNANKHTADGLIRVCVSSGDGFASFFVEDNGTGIAPELLPKVFERGVSGDQSSGLGLAISREIIEESGGIIEVARTGETGTCLRFTVPLWKEDEA